MSDHCDSVGMATGVTGGRVSQGPIVKVIWLEADAAAALPLGAAAAHAADTFTPMSSPTVVVKVRLNSPLSLAPEEVPSTLSCWPIGRDVPPAMATEATEEVDAPALACGLMSASAAAVPPPEAAADAAPSWAMALTVPRQVAHTGAGSPGLSP